MNGIVVRRGKVQLDCFKRIDCQVIGDDEAVYQVIPEVCVVCSGIRTVKGTADWHTAVRDQAQPRIKVIHIDYAGCSHARADRASVLVGIGENLVQVAADNRVIAFIKLRLQEISRHRGQGCPAGAVIISFRVQVYC